MLIIIWVFRKIIFLLENYKNDQLNNVKQKVLNGAYLSFHSLVRQNILNKIQHFSKESNFSNISDEFSLSHKPILKKKTVWVMWWQNDNIPKIISKNIKFFQASDAYEVIVINELNIFNYLDIPKSILDDVKKSRISFAHFSDLVRMSLLYEYGGIWIDSTVFVANTKWEWLLDEEFVTIKNGQSSFGNKFVSSGRWTLYVIGGQPGFKLFEFVRNILYLYMINGVKFPDYFITDYLIDIAEKKNIDNFSKILGNLKENNEYHETLEKYLNEIFNLDLYNELTNDTSFFKLTYKKNYMTRVNDRDTFFGKIYGE